VAREVFQEAEIELAIGVAIKDLLSIVSALCNVMRKARKDDAWSAGHMELLVSAGTSLLKKGDKGL
jgi:hypothetical protein